MPLPTCDGTRTIFATQALTLALVASSCCQAKIELKFMENIKLPSSYRDNKFSATAADLTYEWDSAHSTHPQNVPDKAFSSC